MICNNLSSSGLVIVIVGGVRMGLYFVNMENETGSFARFMEQHGSSPEAEHHVHGPQTRTRPESKEEPALHYVETGEAMIQIDGEVTAKLGTGHSFTGVLVPAGSTVQWNIALGAQVRVLTGEKEILEVITPVGGV